MQYYGYAGRSLFMDLTEEKSKVETLDMSLAEKFVGGEGFTAHRVYHLLTPGTDALSPANPIALACGALVGTLAPGATQTILMTKGAISGMIRKGAVGGAFGPMLKWAGYDELILVGRSKKPAYLTVFDDVVELHDATDLWGKDINETTKELWRRHGKECSVMAIGQAGENLVKIAMAMVDEISHLGKDGFGAVMGSKNLKAIVVRGTKGVAIADKIRFMNTVNAYLESIRQVPLLKRWQRFGLVSFLEQYLKSGQMFIGKSSRESVPEREHLEHFGIEKLDGIIARPYACPACHLGDKCFVNVPEVGEVTLSAMLNLAAWGARGAKDSQEAAKLHDMANRTGICFLSVCDVVNWLTDLYEHGVITEEDLDGLVPRYDSETLETLLQKAISRQGIGDVIAEGWTGAKRRIGRGSEKYATDIKGLGTEFDPRAAFGSEAFSQMTRPSGGSPPIEAMAVTMRDGEMPVEKIPKWVSKRGIVPAEAMERVFSGPPSGFHVGRYTSYMENWYTLHDCLGTCARPFVGMMYQLPWLAELFCSATGIEKSHDELMHIAERVWNLAKVVNLREGFDRKDDQLPDRFIDEPLVANLEAGKKEFFLSDYARSHRITREELNSLLDGYYEERGWDLEKGWPTRTKLVEAGLVEVADDLAKGGFEISD